MAKKLKGAAAASADIFDTIARGNTADTVDTADTQDTQDTRKAKPEYYRFNLKMPLEYKEYLQAAAYRASSPEKTITITEYLCELVKADMDAHPEWMDSIDHLNK